MFEYGQIPATRASVYTKSVNGVTENDTARHIIHTIRNTRKPNVRNNTLCFASDRPGKGPHI